VSGGIKKCQRVFRVNFVSETAQVELNSGRVSAPTHALRPAVGQRLERAGGQGAVSHRLTWVILGLRGK
jgi:hypothetical protein